MCPLLSGTPTYHLPPVKAPTGSKKKSTKHCFLCGKKTGLATSYECRYKSLQPVSHSFNHSVSYSVCHSFLSFKTPLFVQSGVFFFSSSFCLYLCSLLLSLLEILPTTSVWSTSFSWVFFQAYTLNLMQQYVTLIS